MTTSPAARRTPRPQFCSDPQDPDRAVARLMLAALPTAVSCGRRFTAAQLRVRGPAGLVGDCVPVVSELLTNAVTAVGGGPVPGNYAELYDRPPAIIALRLRPTGRRLVCEVWDGVDEPPAPARPGALDEGGRGLLMVAAPADGWGCRPCPNGGKVVLACWELTR